MLSTETGCTVHYVVPELDAGQSIARAEVPVLPGDTEATLSARILAAEHQLYAQALKKSAATKTLQIGLDITKGLGAGAKPEVGRYDASYGLLLTGDGKDNFTPVSASESGIRMDGEVRDIISLSSAKKSLILVSRNNDSILTYSTKHK